MQKNDSQIFDIAEFVKQLERVRLEMKNHNSSAPEHDEAIGLIASAEKAAKSGDKNSAFKALKGAGSWALEIAKSVTANLVKDAIEGKFGT